MTKSVAMWTGSGMRFGYSHYFYHLITLHQAGQVASLDMSLGFCGHQKKMSWTSIGIIIGCIVGAVLVIGLVAFFVSRRKYAQASTRDY